jgi:hypothetical protein
LFLAFPFHSFVIKLIADSSLFVIGKHDLKKDYQSEKHQGIISSFLIEVDFYFFN